MADRAHQPRLWDRARRFGGPFISERHRRCNVCGRRFLNGALIVEFGYTTNAICERCLEDAQDVRADVETQLQAN